MSAPTTGQLADIPDHLPAIAPPIGPAVDVLAVLDAAIQRGLNTAAARDAEGRPFCKREAVERTDALTEARAAMTQLIQAANKLASQPALDDMAFMVNRPGVVLALIELRAALARVGGAA